MPLPTSFCVGTCKKGDNWLSHFIHNVIQLHISLRAYALPGRQHNNKSREHRESRSLFLLYGVRDENWTEVHKQKRLCSLSLCVVCRCHQSVCTQHAQWLSRLIIREVQAAARGLEVYWIWFGSQRVFVIRAAR